jgi:hypothetical protein
MTILDFGGFGSKIRRKYLRLLRFEGDFDIILELIGLVA